jgi:regulatory protein
MTEKEALNQAMKLCSKKEYASGEILNKLIDWEISAEVASKLVAELIREKFIDDTRYARAFVNDKLKFSRWGRIKIQYMLKQKGVSEHVIKEALEDIDSAIYEEILSQELLKKARTIKTESEYELKGKLVQFASGRGFEYDVAARLAEKIRKR